MTTQTERMREALRKVIDVATEKTHHVYAGYCPDSTQSWMRDETCAACQIIMEAERAAFAEELSAWDIDPPLHHVKASHDEIAGLLAASPTPPQAEQADAAKPKNVPFQVDTWELDADGFAPTLCTECGTPVRYGSRHSKCGHKLQEAEAAKPATLSDFVRADASTRAAIGARVADAAVEMQREVMAKPETERAALLRKIEKRLAREIDFQNVFSDMELLKEAAALLSADSKDAGEPVANACKCSECGEWQYWTTSGMTCKNGHGGAAGINTTIRNTRPQAADAQRVLKTKNPASITGKDNAS